LQKNKSSKKAHRKILVRISIDENMEKKPTKTVG
jgi:hypothetical protein